MLLVTLLGWIGLTLCIAVVGALLGMAVVRWRLIRRIRGELGPGKVLLVTASRLASLEEAGGPRGLRHAGVLVLLRRGVYYRSWFGKREVFVPGAAITYIGLSESANGRAHEAGAVVLRFLNSMGKEDGVVIRLLSPEQWISAVKTHLIARP
jgi:hypothetical protein